MVITLATKVTNYYHCTKCICSCF